jgi:hypothetical protein
MTAHQERLKRRVCSDALITCRAPRNFDATAMATARSTNTLEIDDLIEPYEKLYGPYGPCTLDDASRCAYNLLTSVLRSR